MIANIHLHRPFILKLTLKQPSSSSSSVSGHSPLITFAGDPQFLSSSSASRESSTITHLSSSSQGNSDTCFISMRQPSDFKLTLQINSLPGNVAEDVSQLLLYACNSLNCGDTKEMEAKEAKKGETLDESGKVYKLFDYQIKVKSYPKVCARAPGRYYADMPIWNVIWRPDKWPLIELMVLTIFFFSSYFFD